jgi:hypothetical protein
MTYPFDTVRSQMFITADIGQDPRQTRIFAGKQHEQNQYGDTYTHRTGLISPKLNRLLFFLSLVEFLRSGQTSAGASIHLPIQWIQGVLN